MILKEDVESKSQDKARKLVQQKLNYDGVKAREVVSQVRSLCPSLKVKKFKETNKQCGKFTFGITRIFLDNPKLEADGDACAFLNYVVQNITDTQYETYDQNLNNLTFEQIKSQFYPEYKSNVSDMYSLIRNTDYSKTPSKYTVVKIKSQKDLKVFKPYTDWCIISRKDMYDQYAAEGWNQFFVFLKNGFEKIKKNKNSNNPKDEYGLSMIAVSVTNKGQLNTCTGRYNHDKGGNDNLLNAKELSDIVKIRFTDVADQRDNKDFSKAVVQDIQNLSFKELSEKYETEKLNDNLVKLFFKKKFCIFDKNRKIIKDKFGEVGWFNNIYDFKEGKAKVNLNGKWNFIDKEGNIVLKQWFDYAYDFEEGKAKVEFNGKFNFIDEEGNLISKQWFDAAYNFYEGRAAVNLNGKWNFIDKEGNIVLKQWFDKIEAFYYEGKTMVELNGKFNFFNKEGNLISKQWFDKVSPFYKGRGKVKLNDKWNFIDEEGNIVLKQWFDYVYNYCEGRAKVELNDKQNFIDTKGNLISKQWFDKIEDFYGGKAKVKLNGKQFFIDKNGNRI